MSFRASLRSMVQRLRRSSRLTTSIAAKAAGIAITARANEGDSPNRAKAGTRIASRTRSESPRPMANPTIRARTLSHRLACPDLKVHADPFIRWPGSEPAQVPRRCQSFRR